MKVIFDKILDELREADPISIGIPIIGGAPNEILYIDPSGNLAGDARFTFDQVTGEINVSSVLNIEDGAYLYITEGGSATLQYGSIMNMEYGSVVGMQDGSLVNMEAGSTIQLEAGALIFVDYGGLIDVADGGSLYIESGGALNVKSSGTLTIESGGAMLIVDPGTPGTLAGSPPTFTDYYGGDTNALGDPDAWMPIVVNGTAYSIPLYL